MVESSVVESNRGVKPTGTDLEIVTGLVGQFCPLDIDTPGVGSVRPDYNFAQEADRVGQFGSHE